MKVLLIFFALASLSCGEVSNFFYGQPAAVYYQDPTTMQGRPNPYSFQYNAGSFPGHVDRAQSETGDGVERARNRHLDLYDKIAAEHLAIGEQGGQRSLLRNPPRETTSAERPWNRHLDLYDKIAADHAAIGAHRAQRSYVKNPPRELTNEERARNRHLDLYDKIAADHLAIGEQHTGQRSLLRNPPRVFTAGKFIIT